jgi:sugar phosphate isomerase/epimerase
LPITSPPALQLYSLREQLGDDRLPILRQVAAFGYGAVETWDVGTDPERMRAGLDQAGLTACSAHGQVLAVTDPQGHVAAADAAAIFRGAATVGTDTVIVPWAPPARVADADAVAALARDLNEAAAQAADHGLRLGYHNHDFELSSVIGGVPALVVLADALDPAVILEVDTYWAAVGGQDVPALLGRLGDRVRYLHVKDGPVTKDDPMTAVGSGRMPVAEILAACPSAEWHIVELDRCATDMLTAVGDSLAWLAGHGLATPVSRATSTSEPA